MDKKIIVYGEGRSNLSLTKFYDKNHLAYAFLHEEDEVEKLDLSNISYVVKAPGIYPKASKYHFFKDQKIKVVTYLEECFKFYPNLDYIVVTGTNGKTTTVKLIYEMLKSLNYDYGGNSDRALFDVRLDEVKGVVIEASSFMLRDTTIVHPHIYIITNLSPHHLDYHESAQDYLDSKLKVIKNMTKGDVIISLYGLDLIDKYNINKVDVFTFSSDNVNANLYLKEKKVYYQNKELLDLSFIDNTHLLEDILMMIMVGIIYQIDLKIMEMTIKNFIPLSHRFEIIKETSDYIFIDDAKSTSVHALLGALKETNILFSNFQTLLIMGGKDTLEEYRELLPFLKKVKTLYLYGEIKDKVYLLFKDVVRIKVFDNLEMVMRSVFKDLKSKDLVLFSPGASSLDQFSSFELRGNIYQTMVRDFFNKEQKKEND